MRSLTHACLKTMIAASVAIGALGSAAAQEGNAEEGAEVFKKCRACHDVGPDAKNKVGPLLNGILGRKAGTIEGFSLFGCQQGRRRQRSGVDRGGDAQVPGESAHLHAGNQDGVRRPQGRAGPQGLDRLPQEVPENSRRSAPGRRMPQQPCQDRPHNRPKAARASACSSPASSTCSGRRSASRRSSCSSDAGCEVEVPAAQTCCGQPAYNSGDKADGAASLRGRRSPPSRRYDYVVAPSGSCAGMLKLHYPDAAGGRSDLERAGQRRSRAKVHELISFLVDVRGVDGRRCRARRPAPPTTTAARACASSASASSRAQLLRSVEGLELVELTDARGVLRLRRHLLASSIPTSPTPSSSDKARAHRRDRRRPAARRRSRLPDEHGGQARPARAATIAVRHVAEVLAGELADPAIGERRMSTMHARPPSRTTPARRSATRSCSGRSPRWRRAWPRSAAPRAPACRSSRRCATSAATSRTTRSRISTSTSRSSSARPTRAGAIVHWAPTRRGRAPDRARASAARPSARVVTKGKSMISEEIGLNAALEGDGIEVVETDLGEYLIQIRGETPSHIIAPAIHLTQDQVEADFRRLHTQPAGGPRAGRARAARRRGAPDPAREVPRRRCRHHRRQLPDRRDRLLRDRHQRGQRRPDAVAAQGAHRARLASRRWCRRWRT